MPLSLLRTDATSRCYIQPNFKICEFAGDGYLFPSPGHSGSDLSFAVLYRVLRLGKITSSELSFTGPLFALLYRSLGL